MGVKNLWDVLETCKKTLPLHHLQNKRVCIDLSCWMVQLHNVNKSHCSMKDKLYLKGLFHRIRALIGLNCSIIFVTDGSIPALKVSTYKRRLNLETEVAQDESSTNKVSSLRRNMGSEFSCMIKEAKILGAALGVPCLDGAEEGEAQCALLDSESLCDGCFSSDSDIFLFGARTVYRDICLGEGGYVVCYEMADIERKLGFGRNSLIALALLLGCDYSPGVHGLGPESACLIVKALGESAVLRRIASEDLSLLKKAICSKKQSQLQRYNNKENIPPHDIILNGGKNNSQSNYQFLQVIDAYMKPKCHSADSERVHRVLGLYPFQRTNLQQTCSQFFEWPPEKTDEYILPKIAERDLRRFANLRAASSQLGVRLPLDKMPVKCPVSEIIKRRKVQGKECFEVSWEEVDGLGNSVVPSELIESACPEKILEFEERLAEKKKPKPRKPRVKKSGKNNESTNEVDAKLQQLLLDIERDSSAAHTSRLHTGSSLSKTPAIAQVDQTSCLHAGSSLSKTPAIAQVDQTNQELVLNTRSYGKEVMVKENTTKDCCFNSSSFGDTIVDLLTPLLETKSKSRVEAEVIDLLSPSPLVRPFNTSKCREGNVSSIDVMELSESETDVSPEHARKARELRLFVASIRD